MSQKEVSHLPVSPEIAKSDCILECFYDKELGCCGSCFRTLEEIAEAGRKKKFGEQNIE